jgi:glycine/D-amino acid oxidase-like deaminating enzyme
MNSRLLTAASLWAATAGTAADDSQLCSDENAEVTVIGAGYTGLSAALHLAKSGRTVVVLDARGLGDAASGRNGGQVIPGLKSDPDELAQHFGEPLVNLVAGGPAKVFELIDHHGIECDAMRSGWIQAATSDDAMRVIESRVRQWRSRGADVQLLNAAEIAALTGSRRYVGGWIDRRGGTVQPLKLLHGIARAARECGVRVFTHSTAVEMAREGAGWRVRTARGQVRSTQVVLAVNGYGDALCEPLRRSVVPVPSMQVATVPLSAALLRDILPRRQSVSDTWRLLRYFRLDAGGRLVMGTRGLYGDPDPGRAARPHYRAVTEIYPQLAGVPFEHHWSGFVAMTPDHLPHLHELQPGMVAALGYNGRGVALSITMGGVLARWLNGTPAADLGFPVSGLKPIRLHRFSRWGVSAMIQYYRLLDAWSARGTRRG